MAFLHEIKQRKDEEIAAAKKLRSIGDLKRMVRDAPPLRNFAGALGRGFGLIGEIKQRSPSAGEMRKENVKEAPIAYARSRIVNAVSVLTNGADFGMGIEDLMKAKSVVHQPILRKDFISTEYEIHESRAFGADAVLLMASFLDRTQMQKLFNLSCELNMDVLFEAHTRKEIDAIPEGAKIYGINSRKFMASKRWRLTQILVRMWKSGRAPDCTIEPQTFSLLFKDLPNHAIKVAESGIKPSKVREIANMGYDAVLIGTSLLKAPAGIQNMLSEFEAALDIPSRRVASPAGLAVHA